MNDTYNVQPLRLENGRWLVLVLLMSTIGNGHAFLLPSRGSHVIATSTSDPSRQRLVQFTSQLPRTATPQKQIDQTAYYDDQNPQQPPLLARAYSRAIRVAIRCCTLFGRLDGLRVDCNASSNRDVALGRISSLRIAFDRLSSPFLKTRDFQLVGENLELGYGPIMLLGAPFVFLLLRRRTLPLLFCIFWLQRRLAKRNSTGKQPQSKKDLPGKQQQLSMATYRLGLAGEDLSHPNTILRLSLSRSMDHLLRNSVVGLLTESALAAAKVQAQTPTKNAALTGTTRTIASDPENQMAQLSAALDESSTKLELKEVTVGDDGRLLLDAVATFPDPYSGTPSQLDFVVRLSVSPLDETLQRPSATSNSSSSSTVQGAGVDDKHNCWHQGCGIMVTNAELKASFNKETMRGIPLEIFGKPIPDVWIPVVSGGLAFPFGNWHRVVSLESVSSQDRMDVCGEIYFNGDEAPPRTENTKGGFGLIWNSLPFGGSSSPPPPRRPALPANNT